MRNTTLACRIPRDRLPPQPKRRFELDPDFVKQALRANTAVLVERQRRNGGWKLCPTLSSVEEIYGDKLSWWLQRMPSDRHLGRDQIRLDKTTAGLFWVMYGSGLVPGAHLRLSHLTLGELLNGTSLPRRGPKDLPGREVFELLQRAAQLGAPDRVRAICWQFLER